MHDVPLRGTANIAMTRSSRLASRYTALLAINEVARTASTIEDAFRRTCRVLKQLVFYDRAALALYDAAHNAMIIKAVYGSNKRSVFQPGYKLSKIPGRSTWTFQHETARVSRDLTKENFKSEKQVLDEGYPSLCSVPLLARGKSVGFIAIFGAQKGQFSAREAELVQELSNQITMAILLMTQSCPTHPDTKLLCPKCIGAKGGKATVSKWRQALAEWGKEGGRGHKKGGIN